MGHLQLARDAAEVLDGAGMTLTPGLVDSHIHPFHGTDGTRGADLQGLRTIDELRGAIAAERARCAPGEWVLGWGLSYDVFNGRAIAADATMARPRPDPPVCRCRLESPRQNRSKM